METFFIQNFGCRATQADAAAIRADLLALGYNAASSEDHAGIVVLNTCTVTAAADAEAREAIRRIHRRNPAARIVATGCYAQRAPEELAEIPGVACVVGNSHQHAIGKLISGAGIVPVSALSSGVLHSETFHADMRAITAPMAPLSLHSHLTSDCSGLRTRPTLKIQDGCNDRCAYCVIPFVRGRSRSAEPAAIIAEIGYLAESGVQELVLSGIDLGSYGRDLRSRVSLQSLIRKIVSETSISRLRLSSIEPIDVTRDFVEFVASEPRIAPHFHMPLQSGSDKILRAMHRWYRAAHYARRVEMIREVLPHAAVGADVITGFPGETDGDHATTSHFLANLPLSYLHVFSFSPRPGTEAANLPAQVPSQIIQERARELRAIGREKSKEFRAAQAGQRFRALTLESRDEVSTTAITGNYLHLRIAGSWPSNRWVEATLPVSDSDIVAAEPAGL